MPRKKKREISSIPNLSPENKAAFELLEKLANPKPYDPARAKAFADESLRRYREVLKQSESPKA